MLPKEFEAKKDDFLVYLDVEKNLSEHTQRAYQNDLEQFLEFWNTICDKEQVTVPIRRAIERFLVHMYHKKIDKSSIARKVSCFKSFERFITSRGTKIHFNLSRPKLDKKLPVYLTIDEMFHLLDKVKEETLPTTHPYRDKAILELLYATGVRCSELVGIRLCDLDITNRVIRVMGKGRKERLVIFGEKAKEKLINYLEKERPKAINLSEKLFLNNRNEMLSPRSIQRTIEMFRKFLKIERKITPHKIRHSFATHMLNQGVDLRIVQELLGHKTLSSTEKYTHVTTSELSKLCDNFHPINSMLKNKK